MAQNSPASEPASMINWFLDEESRPLSVFVAAPVIACLTQLALFHSKLILLSLQKSPGFRYFAYSSCSLEVLFAEGFITAAALLLHWNISPVNQLTVSLVSVHVMVCFLSATFCMMSQGKLPFGIYMLVLRPGFSTGTASVVLLFAAQAAAFYAQCVGMVLNTNTNAAVLVVAVSLFVYRKYVEKILIQEGITIHQRAVAQAKAKAAKKAQATEGEKAVPAGDKSTPKVPTKLAGNPGSALKTNIEVKGTNSYYYAHATTKEEQITKGGAPQRILSPKSAMEEDTAAGLNSITTYAVDDGKKTIKVYLSRDLLSSDVPEGDFVFSSDCEHELDWTESSCRVRLGKNVLDIRPLHKTIKGAKVQVKSTKIALVLTKVEQTSWPNLKQK